MFAISRTPEFTRGTVNIWTDGKAAVIFAQLRDHLAWTDVEGPFVFDRYLYPMASFTCGAERARDVVGVMLAIGLVQGRYQFCRLWPQAPLPHEVDSILSAAEDAAHGEFS